MTAMTLRELLGEVAPTKLEAAADVELGDALHDAEGHEAPLLVRLFSAIGTWIGAAMLAVIVFALEIVEVVPLALTLAVGLSVGAVLLSRRPRRSLALTQLVWAMMLGAHALVAGACFELDVEPESLAVLWTVINLATMFVVRVPSYALASAVCAVAAATWLGALLELPMYPLWVALPAAGVATLAWVREAAWARRLGRSWIALAYGLPIGVAGPLSLVGLDDGPGLVATGAGATLATLAMLGLVGLVLVQARREQGGDIDRRSYALGGIAVLAMLAARHVPGLSLALLWLLVAHLRRSTSLQILASIQLAGFLFFFYYQLDTSLLNKSLWVLSTGVVLLVGAWLARPRVEAKPGAEHAQRRSRWIPALVLVGLTSALVVVPSLVKQRVLARGQTVLLPLAPVDPRSLMQGDYMVLRYELEQEVLGAPFDDEPPNIPRHGTLVLELDDAGVGHFVGLDDGAALGPGRLRLEYRLREGWDGRLRVGAESFLFEEGSADVYAGARYGELVVAEDGEAILVGLRGADRQPLGLRLHDR